MKDTSRYARIIESIFLKHYKRRARSIPFTREEIVKTARSLKIDLPKNLGDVVYSFRYRAPLPKTVRDKAPRGKEWIIRPAGKSKYCFVAIAKATIAPNRTLAVTKVPDSTPGVIAMYALSDEQALLAKL